MTIPRSRRKRKRTTDHGDESDRPSLKTIREKIKGIEKESERQRRLISDLHSVFDKKQRLEEDLLDTLRFCMYGSTEVIKSVRNRVTERDDSTCQKCGKHLDPDDVTIDHMIPRRVGGPAKMWNLQVMCGRCNRAKGSRLEEDAIMDAVERYWRTNEVHEE